MPERDKINYVREAVIAFLRQNHVTGGQKIACEEFVAESLNLLRDIDTDMRRYLLAPKSGDLFTDAAGTPVPIGAEPEPPAPEPEPEMEQEQGQAQGQDQEQEQEQKGTVV